ncbi:MAG: beta-galactosidase [Chloroflexia bacterium]|nr:beta-galactosidase [Chloroflexia bacterium]
MSSKNLLKPLFCLLSILLFAIPGYATPQAETASLPPLPTVWQIIWSDQVSVQEAQRLKSMGFDALFKCVACRPAYPQTPIWAAGEWRLVESVEGQYDWSDMRRCLDAALQANMWVIPEIVINIPPDWFVQRFPDSLLQDSRGITLTNPDETGAPYLLSPWFIATGAADAYLVPYVNSFLDLVSPYPNVAGIMMGNFKLNTLPWGLGPSDSDQFTYWPIWDQAAQASYRARFGTLPISTWDDYQALENAAQANFRDWLTSAVRENLQNRYLPWVASFPGWKVINASIWNGNEVRESIFTTTTPEMTAAKQTAIKQSGVAGIVINDDNLGDCGLAGRQQEDIDLAASNGFKLVGERVPGLPACDWSAVYTMWIGFNPRPDGFVNIAEPDASWIGQYRTLYGTASEPLSLRVYVPLVQK